MNSKVLLELFLVLLGIHGGKLINLNRHPSWKYLPQGECGIGSLTDRIVGGQEATLGQFPWLVRLGYLINRSRSKLYYLCAGSLINRWYILTAKHCFDGLLGKTIKNVRLGENFLDKSVDCEDDICAPPVQDIDIRDIITSNSTSTTYGDIALAKLKQPATFNDFVQPICLPRGRLLRNPSKHLSLGTVVEVAGWGTTTSETKRIPNKLMYVKMPVVELEQCMKNFPERLIDKSVICVGIGEGRDSCVGDSGAPIVKAYAIDSPPKYFIFGLVSYGMKSCGVAAAVYTNITHYMKWVLDNIEPVE